MSGISGNVPRIYEAPPRPAAIDRDLQGRVAGALQSKANRNRRGDRVVGAGSRIPSHNGDVTVAAGKPVGRFDVDASVAFPLHIDGAAQGNVLRMRGAGRE